MKFLEGAVIKITVQCQEEAVNDNDCFLLKFNGTTNAGNQDITDLFIIPFPFPVSIQTVFQRPSDVHDVQKTLNRRRPNDVLC